MSRFGAGELLRGVMLLGLVCAVCAAFPALGFVVAGGGVWAVPYGVTRALLQSARGKPDPTRTAEWWTRGFLVCALAMTGSLIGVGQILKACEVRAAPVIAALELYKARRGHYPAKLSGLVPDPLPAVPDGFSEGPGLDGIRYYHHAKDRETYSLTYFPVMLLPLRHSYGPTTGKWMTWD